MDVRENRLLQKIRAIPLGARASIALFFASLTTKGIAYLTTPLYTRLLTPAEYGRTSVFLTWLEVLGIVAMFCLSSNVFSNGMIDHPDDRDRFLFSMLTLSNFVTLAFGGVLFVLYPLLRGFLDLEPALLGLMFAVFLTQPAYVFWMTRQRFEYKYKYNALFAVAAALLPAVVSTVCMACCPPGERLYARIFGAEVPLLGFYLCFYVYLARKSHGRVCPAYWKTAFLFNLPIIPHYLSLYLLNSSDKLMISAMVGDAQTAFYSVAYAISSAVFVVWNAIDASLLPYVYENCKRRNYAAVSRVTTPLLTVFAAACFLLILLAPEAVRLMATGDYYEAIYVIPPVVGGVFFQVIFSLFSNVVQFYKKPVYVMAGSLTAAGLNLLLNYLLIGRFGYLAAGYTTLFCFALQALIDFFAMKKCTKEPIYNTKQIALLSAVVFAVALGSGLLYRFLLLRYGIALAALVVCLLLRKKIFAQFALLKKS